MHRESPKLQHVNTLSDIKIVFAVHPDNQESKF